jgi:hypothetical protein
MDAEEMQARARFAPIDAYNHALIDVGHALAKAVRAIEGNDVDLFRISAADAVSAWIATNAAYQCFAQEVGDLPLVDATRCRLDERYDDLRELLTTAESKFAGAALQIRIEYMRESLSIACGEAQTAHI